MDGELCRKDIQITNSECHTLLPHSKNKIQKVQARIRLTVSQKEGSQMDKFKVESSTSSDQSGTEEKTDQQSEHNRDDNSKHT